MFLELIIYYGSYLVFPFIIGISFLYQKKRRLKKKNKISSCIYIFLILLSILFIYSRFIERYMISNEETVIEADFNAKFVVISDIHLGIYKKSSYLKRVINKINKIDDVDAVLIPGDFTYDPLKEDLVALFSPLKECKYPVYGVIGNHDTGFEQFYKRDSLENALMENDVILLQNKSSKIKNKNITILGLGDRWANEDDVDKIENYMHKENLVVLAHNPDTVLDITNSIPDLIVSGHTHGGQIRIPFLYKIAIRSEGNFDKGLYQNPRWKLFVSSGIGEIGLPMRLGVRPVIDILILER